MVEGEMRDVSEGGIRQSGENDGYTRRQMVATDGETGRG